eukprot:CAMPEP_0170481358 /NCGR_PEP_ID=MMETSP0208-20121228/1829_1 /TAXON_ID=197538 /ORGANISM="Strombidium inclinatum, Strain S3" /LENGTH=77 /DNA_ID=CAMNT_0010754045 /DNA_START=908 /DNA_END=1141 /DNA_ORIENTATION=-
MRGVWCRNGRKADVASKGFHDLLRYNEAKADAVGVKGLSIFDEAEELEQLVLVFVGDSDSSIFNINAQIVGIFLMIY